MASVFLTYLRDASVALEEAFAVVLATAVALTLVVALAVPLAFLTALLVVLAVAFAVTLALESIQFLANVSSSASTLIFCSD